MNIIFCGDLMLGRLVKNAIKENGFKYPLEKITHILKSSNLTIVNLECAITDSSTIWQGTKKAFYFGAPSIAAKTLSYFGIDVVNLANNHSLDFDYKGLEDTFLNLQREQIKYVGAGLDKKQATAPLYFQKNDLRFGMISYCDHQEDFAATISKPGISYLDISNTSLAIETIQQSIKIMMQRQIDWPILSLHWGPNMVNRPNENFINVAHAAIDAGIKIIFGHSAHVFHGIEIYKGCPIIYAAGDFVNDYQVDEYFRNDMQLLFELQLDKNKINNLKLYPIFISNCRVQPASTIEKKYIFDRAKQLCLEFNTKLIQQNDNSFSVVLN